MDCIDAVIMAALGYRFNRRIYGCRWSFLARQVRRAKIANATVSLSFYSQPSHGPHGSTDRTRSVPSQQELGGRPINREGFFSTRAANSGVMIYVAWGC